MAASSSITSAPDTEPVDSPSSTCMIGRCTGSLPSSRPLYRLPTGDPARRRPSATGARDPNQRDGQHRAKITKPLHRRATTFVRHAVAVLVLAILTPSPAFASEITPRQSYTRIVAAFKHNSVPGVCQKWTTPGFRRKMIGQAVSLGLTGYGCTGLIQAGAGSAIYRNVLKGERYRYSRRFPGHRVRVYTTSSWFCLQRAGDFDGNVFFVAALRQGCR